MDRLAQEAYTSKFHLTRIFKQLTGKGLMEYVRARRLTESLSELLTGQLRVSDIAQEYGFEHHQSYIRAFRDEFGVTPAHYRKTPVPLTVTGRLERRNFTPAGQGILLTPEMVVKPAFQVMGIRYKVYDRDNQQNLTANTLGRDFFFNRRHRIPDAVSKEVYIGLTRVPDDYGGYTDYLPSLEVLSGGNLPEGMVTDWVAAHKYAVFRYIGLHSPEEISAKTLQDIWAYVFGEWMQTADFGPRERISFERIDYGLCSDSYCEAELYYPVSRL